MGSQKPMATVVRTGVPLLGLYLVGCLLLNFPHVPIKPTTLAGWGDNPLVVLPAIVLYLLALGINRPNSRSDA